MGKVPLYSKKAAKRIGEEGGMDELDAVRVAATEMEGAAMAKEGGINAAQTACPVLKYNENLPPSLGQKEGKNKTLRDLKVETENEADKLTDKWLEEQGGWTK